MATTKKVTHVSGGSDAPQKTTFVPTEEAKGRAGKNRLLAVLLWILAIAAQIIAIVILLKKDPETALTIGQNALIIGILLVDLILLVAGSSFWKKANRLDPPSKASALFSIQSQLGAIMAAVCFLPVLIVAIIKKAWFVVAAAALFGIGGGIASSDRHPASIEEYTEQTNKVEWLNNGVNQVYWTKSGSKYHLFDDCSHINSNRTDEIFSGTVAQARELKNITELCKTCENRAVKEHGLNEADYKQPAAEEIPAVTE